MSEDLIFRLDDDNPFTLAKTLLYIGASEMYLEIPETIFADITMDAAIYLASEMKAFDEEAIKVGFNHISKIEDDNRHLVIYHLKRVDV